MQNQPSAVMTYTPTLWWVVGLVFMDAVAFYKGKRADLCIWSESPYVICFIFLFPRFFFVFGMIEDSCMKPGPFCLKSHLLLIRAITSCSWLQQRAQCHRHGVVALSAGGAFGSSFCLRRSLFTIATAGEDAEERHGVSWK